MPTFALKKSDGNHYSSVTTPQNIASKGKKDPIFLFVDGTTGCPGHAFLGCFDINCIIHSIFFFYTLKNPEYLTYPRALCLFL